MHSRKRLCIPSDDNNSRLFLERNDWVYEGLQVKPDPLIVILYFWRRDDYNDALCAFLLTLKMHKLKLRRKNAPHTNASICRKNVFWLAWDGILGRFNKGLFPKTSFTDRMIQLSVGTGFSGHCFSTCLSSDTTEQSAGACNPTQ